MKPDAEFDRESGLFPSSRFMDGFSGYATRIGFCFVVGVCFWLVSVGDCLARKVVKPVETITVVRVDDAGAACQRPGQRIDGCWYESSRTIVLGPEATRYTFWHEMGHAVDSFVLKPADRRFFGRLVSRKQIFWPERFADVYMWCRSLKRIGAGWTFSVGQSGQINAKRLRKACRRLSP